MGKHLHVVTFTFNILDEGQKAEGNYSLAIFREQESYECPCQHLSRSGHPLLPK